MKVMKHSQLLYVRSRPTVSLSDSKIAAVEGQPHSLYLDIRLNCDKRYLTVVKYLKFHGVHALNI